MSDLCSPIKDRPFVLRRPVSARIEQVIREAVRFARNYEEYEVEYESIPARGRRRRQIDLRRFEEIIAYLVCDLLHRHLTCPGGGISISLRTGSAP